jgi:hypothetical protein
VEILYILFGRNWHGGLDLSGRIGWRSCRFFYSLGEGFLQNRISTGVLPLGLRVELSNRGAAFDRKHVRGKHVTIAVDFEDVNVLPVASS